VGGVVVAQNQHAVVQGQFVSTKAGGPRFPDDQIAIAFSKRPAIRRHDFI